MVLAPTEKTSAACSLGAEVIYQTYCSFSNKGDGSSGSYSLSRISERNFQWYVFMWELNKGQFDIIDSDTNVLVGTLGQAKDYIQNSKLDLCNVWHISDGAEHFACRLC